MAAAERGPPNAALTRLASPTGAGIIRRRAGEGFSFRPPSPMTSPPSDSSPDSNADRASPAWDAGLLMAVVACACFASAVGYDTLIQSSFDLSKLAVLYGMAMLLAVGVLTKTLSTGEWRLPRTPLDRPIAAMLAALAVSTALSVDRRCSVFGAYKTYEGALEILVFVAFYYAAARLSRREVVVVLAVILAACLAAGAYGLVQWLGRDPLRWTKSIPGRMISVFGNPVFFGAYVAIATPLGWGLFFRGARRDARAPAAWLRWTAGAAWAMLFAAAVYPWLQTHHRGWTTPSGLRAAALLAASAGVCAWFGWRELTGRRGAGWPSALSGAGLLMALAANAAFYETRTLGALGGLAAGAVGFVAYSYFLAPAAFKANARKWALWAGLVLALNAGFNLHPATSALTRVRELVRVRRPGEAAARAPRVKPIGSFYKRLLLWHTGWNIFRAYPLHGVGPDAIERVVAKYWAADYQLRCGRLVQVLGYENRLHDEWLEAAASQGALGVAARLWLYLAFAAMLLRGGRGVPERERPVLAGIAAAWLAFVAQNVVEFPTLPISLMAWTLMGCAAAWVRNGDDPARWPTRRVRLYARPRLVPAACAISVAGLLLAAFWVQCVWLPYRADRSFMKGVSLQRMRRPDLAEKHFQDACDAQPWSHVYRQQLNFVLAALADRVERSRLSAKQKASTLERLSRRLIENGRAHVRYAAWSAWSHAFLAAGEAEAARAERLRTPRPDLQRIRRLEDSAYRGFRKAVEVNPYNIAIRMYLARCCLIQGRWDALADVLEETMRWWPKDPQAPDMARRAARVLIARGQSQKAAEILRRLERTMAPRYAAYAREAWARIHMARGEWAKATDALADALKMWPKKGGRPEAFGYAVKRLIQLKKFDRAERLLTRVDQAAAPRFEGLRASAWANLCFARRDWPGMLRAAQRMIRAKPQPADAYYCLALAYANLNRTKDAEAVCRAVLKARPRDAKIRRLLNALRPAEPAPP